MGKIRAGDDDRIDVGPRNHSLRVTRGIHSSMGFGHLAGSAHIHVANHLKRSPRHFFGYDLCVVGSHEPGTNDCYSQHWTNSFLSVSAVANCCMSLDFKCMSRSMPSISSMGW